MVLNISNLFTNANVSIANLVTTTALNVKTTESENEIYYITGSVASTTLNAKATEIEI